MSPHRDGGQAQFISQPVPPRPAAGLARAMDWALARLDRSIGVDDLAQAAALSPRTLLRRFRSEVGGTPHRWLVRQRVLAAQRRLESTRASIEEIASHVGFGTAQTLRLHFRRILRTSPNAYRQRFSGAPRGSGSVATPRAARRGPTRAVPARPLALTPRAGAASRTRGSRAPRRGAAR